MTDIEQKCRVALQALNDWAVTYASDMCDDETVAKAKARIFEYGTLAYIANATDQLHSAIAALSAAEKREREAIRRAINSAALIGYVTCAETRHVSLGDKVAAAIHALQSKER